MYVDYIQFQMDQFEFECVFLGQLNTATVGHDGHGAGMINTH